MDTAVTPQRLTQWAAADLAQLATEWDRAVVLLEPGRERRWHHHTMSDAQLAAAAAQARADREAKAENTRRGLRAVGYAPAPADLRVVEAMQQAGWAVCELAGYLRQTLNLGPLFPHDAIPTGTVGRTEADARFKAARNWLARAGLHAATGDLLDHAADEIRRALRILTAVTNPQPYTRRITAACPSCQRKSLRAHLDAPHRRDWWVQCHADECRARWEWDQWGALGDLIGVDVWTAVQGSAA